MARSTARRGRRRPSWPCPGTCCCASSAWLDFTVGLLQSTLLWNGIVTALTAALLWLTAVRLGYRDRTGMALGLLFGLATIAWPYANHFFGEPLSALSLLLAFYGIAALAAERRLAGWMLVAGIGAGLAIATVTAHALLIAILGVYAAGRLVATAPPARCADAAAPAGGSLLARRRPRFAVPRCWSPAALLLLLQPGALRQPVRHRLSLRQRRRLHQRPFWQGFWGLIFSPYRGVFWHTPLFLASIVGVRALLPPPPQRGASPSRR